MRETSISRGNCGAGIPVCSETHLGAPFAGRSRVSPAKLGATAQVLITTLTLTAAAVAQTGPALVNQYCTGCHNQKLKTGGVALDNLDGKNVGADAGTWEKVLRKFAAGEMPPAGLPRPNATTSAAFTKWLGDQLDQAAAAHPDPGHPTIHRLNRAEYSNAIRDLLALDIDPGAKLPADDSGYGFDNIGDVLSLSPILIERYMSAARTVSRLAVGDADIKPDTYQFDVPRQKGFNRARVSDDLPFDSNGGLTLTYDFPADGEYLFKIKGPGGKAYEERLQVKAGARTVGVTFLGESELPEVVTGLNFGRRGAAALVPPVPTPGKMDLRLDGARLKLFDIFYTTVPQLSAITISGPFTVAGPGDTPSRQRIFVCQPANEKEELPCADKILATLARRAYRRNVTRSDVSPLIGFYQMGRRNGSFDKGIQMALRAMLVSPDFLFRIERDPVGAGPGSVHHVSDFELASRLSFFLWSSIPDDELLNLAEQGKLKDPAVVSAQVARMLDDRRSKAFVSNFAGQWLYLRNLSQAKPDPDAFPEYDPALRQGFQRETELFFNAILRENRPVTDLLAADFTYLNERLAQHYGIPNVYGSQFRRVALENQNRGGLLGQGSILTVTSYPNRTSVVQRGKWVLENLLGSPPPPPPPDIPALEPKSKDGKVLTMRQQMEQHRTNAVCASCHGRMDPIGFALENYDGVGAWRAKDSGNVIDAAGKLPDGTTFEGPAGLNKLLLTKYHDVFIATFTGKLMTYALGRGVEYYDQPALRAIIRDAAHDNFTIPALIQSIVKSPQFQLRRTPTS
jgi:mono/diheme cytochrome c family protein